MRAGKAVKTLFVLGAFAVLAGCGNGLLLSAVAVPAAAGPGQSVTWTFGMRNNTQCALVNDADLPSGLPDDAPPLLFFFGFTPDFVSSPAAICQALAACEDEECLDDILGGQDVARLEAMRDAARQMSHSEASLSGMPAPGHCEIIGNGDGSGVFGGCVFDNLMPGQSQTLNISDMAPDSGNRQSFQIALAFAAARGTDCSPGIEIGEDLWLVGGCAALPDSAPAPLLSPAGVALLVAALFLTAAFALRQRQQS